MARSYNCNMIPVDFQLLCPYHILDTEYLHVFNTSIINFMAGLIKKLEAE